VNGGVALIWSLLNYGLVLLFGVFAAFFFAGTAHTPKNYRKAALFSLLLIAVQCICWYFFGMNITTKLYPFITHLPLAVFLIIFCKRPALISAVSVFSAYLCCQTARWFGTVSQHIFNSRAVFHITYIIALLPLLYMIKNHIAPSVYKLMRVSIKSLVLFGLVPLMYYMFDYAATVYTDLLFSGARIAVEFMPSVVSMSYFFFVLLYCGEQEKRSESEQNKLMLEAQVSHAGNEIAMLRKLQDQTAIYRHDLRHYISLIRSLVQSGETRKLNEFLDTADKDIVGVTPVRYCENETVNLILSSFCSKAAAVNVPLVIKAVIPRDSLIPDTELCAVLSNGLENALFAAEKIPDNRDKTVFCDCRTFDGRLLIEIRNPCGRVAFEHGLPVSDRQGHGFGVKSISSIAKKHNGLYDFSVKEGMFTMRAVL
jgi:hypothetical protein